MHRSAPALVGLLLALGATPLLSPPADAVTEAATVVAPPVTDFNGDGHADLAIGAPGEDVGSVRDAGAVTVWAGAQQQFTQNSAFVGGTAEAGDHFGASLATGDFDGDGFTDLAVGSPKEDVGSITDAGAVYVLYGSAQGLRGPRHQVFTQNTPGVGSVAERGDLFGSALTAADFNGDGRADLAVGVRHETGRRTNEGAVNVLYGTPSGLTGVGSQLLTQNNAGTANHAEDGDLFGAALAGADFNGDGFADLAVGVPHEGLGAIKAAGAVNVLRGSAGGLTRTGARLFTEDSPGLAGTAETGDGFGTALTAGNLDADGYADLGIGVPAEDIGSVVDAGAAYTLHGSGNGLTGAGSELVTENTHHSSSAKAGDLFGFSLATVDFNDVGEELVVGAPGKDIGSAADAGAVFVDAAEFYEGGANMAGAAQAGDRLGASLADIASHPASVAAGAPGENRGTGAVLVITGNLNDGDQLPPSGAFLNQAAGAAEPGDYFGAALAGS